MGKKKKIIAIDADHILYAIASDPSQGFTPSLGGTSLKVTDGKAELKKLKAKFMAVVEEYEKLAQVESIAYKWEPGETMIVIGDKSNFRYDIYPEYKGNRKGRPMSGQFKKLRKWARKKFSPKQNVEADDVVAYYVRKGAIGFSGDKDLLKGVPGIWFDCYYTRKHWVRTSKEDAHHFNLIQYLAGDRDDNIKGMPMVGIKTAENILVSQGHNWEGVVKAYLVAGLTEEDAILTRRLTSMHQWTPKGGLKLFGE